MVENLLILFFLNLLYYCGTVETVNYRSFEIIVLMHNAIVVKLFKSLNFLEKLNFL